MSAAMRGGVGGVDNAPPAMLNPLSLPPSLPPLPESGAGSVDVSTSAPTTSAPIRKKRGGNRKGSSNWKRREQNVLLDLLETTPKFPSKLDDWNALCVAFNERTSAMGFQQREGKSLRKKWQVLMSSKGAEGEGLNEQEMRAKRLAQGEASLKMEDAAKKRLDGFVSSSPLAPVPLLLHTGAASSSPDGAGGAAAPPPPLTREAVAVAVRTLKNLLQSRQAEFERREYVWAEWRRKDVEEREKTKELLDALIQLDADEGHEPPPMPTQPKKPQR